VDDNRLFPNDQNEAPLIAGNGMVGSRRVNYERACRIGLVAIALGTCQHKNMLITRVGVVGHLGTGLIAQQCCGGSSAIPIQAVNLYTRAEGLPGQGISAIGEGPEIGEVQGWLGVRVTGWMGVSAEPAQRAWVDGWMGDWITQ
jgi:hypothetical protein